MAGWTGLGAGVKALVLGGGAAAAAVVGVVVWQGRTAPEPPAVEAAAPAQVATAPAAKPVPEVVPPTPAEPAALRPEPPSFDVVRVEPDGATLVAGRSVAGQMVAVLVDGVETAVTEADSQGRFVVFLTLASSTSARVMTLELRPTGGDVVPSEDQVVLAPGATAAPKAVAEAPAAEPASEAPAAAPVAEPPAEAVAQAEPQAVEPAPAPVAEAAAAPEAKPAAVTPPAPEPDPQVATAPVAEPTPEAATPEPEAEPAVAAAEPAPTATPEPAPAAALETPVASEAETVPADVASVEPAAGPVPQSEQPPVQGAAEPVVAAAEPAPEAGPAATDPAAVPAAPTALLVSGNSVKVLQSSGDATAGPSSTVSIDTISYTSSGAVTLSGRGAAQAFVRLYLDNRALLDTAIAEDGTWGGTLPAVAPGVYTLRADQVSAAGQVTSRYETPFQREDPVALTAAAPAVAPQTGVAPDVAAPPARVSITVQPGFTLWQIARENYGDGTLYVRVYDANKTLIRDPDLIYPGQVFSVPTGN